MTTMFHQQCYSISLFQFKRKFCWKSRHFWKSLEKLQNESTYRGYQFRSPISVGFPVSRARMKMRESACRLCFNNMLNKVSPWAELDPGSIPAGGTVGVKSPPKGFQISKICDVFLEKIDDKNGRIAENEHLWERCPTCGKLKKVHNYPNTFFQTIPEEE